MSTDSNHLKVARGARCLGDGGVGGVGGVEVALDGALRRMLDLEEALGEAFHLQVQKVQGVNTSLQNVASFPILKSVANLTYPNLFQPNLFQFKISC